MMSSSLGLIRRRQSGRSCESKDSKTNENAFGHSRLLEAATAASVFFLRCLFAVLVIVSSSATLKRDVK